MWIGIYPIISILSLGYLKGNQIMCVKKEKNSRFDGKFCLGNDGDIVTGMKLKIKSTVKSDDKRSKF